MEWGRDKRVGENESNCNMKGNGIFREYFRRCKWGGEVIFEDDVSLDVLVRIWVFWVNIFIIVYYDCFKIF